MNYWAIQNKVKNGGCSSAKQRGYLISVLRDEGFYSSGRGRSSSVGSSGDVSLRGEGDKPSKPVLPLSDEDMGLFQERYRKAKTKADRDIVLEAFPIMKRYTRGHIGCLLQLYNRWKGGF